MKYPGGLWIATGLLAIVVAAPAFVYAQQPAVQTQESHDHEHQGAPAKAADASEQHPGMMHADMMKMMRDMKAGDAKLQALVQAMNAATGAEKTEAIAKLLTAIVEDCGKMHDSMMNMMDAHGSGDPHEPKQ